MLVAGEYNPARRPGTFDEIAAAVEFLCTPNSAYMNGQVIVRYSLLAYYIFSHATRIQAFISL